MNPQLSPLLRPLKRLPLNAALVSAIAVMFSSCANAPPPAPAAPPSTAMTTVPAGGKIPFTGDYINLVDADIKPAAKFMAKPVYPPEHRKNRVEGAVLIAWVLDTSGLPTQVQAINAKDPAFAAAAVEAVKAWRFAPAKKNGQTVACAMQAPVVFSIQ